MDLFRELGVLSLWLKLKFLETEEEGALIVNLIVAPPDQPKLVYFRQSPPLRTPNFTSRPSYYYYYTLSPSLLNSISNKIKYGPLDILPSIRRHIIMHK